MPMHFFSFIRARIGRDPAEFQQWYLTTYAPKLQDAFPNMRRHLVNLCEAGPVELRTVHDSDNPNDRYDVVAETWFDSVVEFRESVEGERAGALHEAADVQNWYLVSDRTVLDRRRPTPARVSGFKLVRELLFHEDLSDAAARRCWAHHGDLALKIHIGMTHYVQHWVEAVLSPKTPRVRGISELFFPTRDDLVERYYESARGRTQILHDTGHFIERRLPRVYAHEHVLKG